MRSFMMASITVLLLITAAWISPQSKDEKGIVKSTYDQEMADYQSWSIIPGSKEKMPGKGAHGKFVTTYANAVALQAMNANSDVLPDGSILMKDNFHKMEDVKPWSAVMMKKVDGKWLFGVFFPPYEVKAAGFGDAKGKLDMCLECHVKAPNDQVFLWQK